jgi:hypothetical protein
MVEEDTFSVPPAQTGLLVERAVPEMLPPTSTEVVPETLPQPLRVSVRVNTPELKGDALIMDGFAVLEVNPFGPDQR